MKLSRIAKFSKPDIFYGWYIVFGLATVGMVSTGMGGINLGLFLIPMSDELSISHVYFGWAYSARFIGFSITSWFIGIMLDRHGARIPMAVAGVLAGLVMVGLSNLYSDWQLVALYLALGMIGLEGAGGNLYQVVPLSRWFVKKRGKAMSFGVFGTAIGIFIFSPLTEYLIATRGWRDTWLILGCIGSIVIVLVGLLLIRKDPQSMKLYPDGASQDGMLSVQSIGSGKSVPKEHSWSREKAIRSYAFWALVLIHGLRMLGSSTIHVFRIPYYIEQGITPHIVAWAISAEALISAVFSLIAGRAADRFKPRYVVSTSLFLFIIMFVVSIYVSNAWHVFVAAALYGASAAMYMVGMNALWPDYFGSANIGSIRGLSLMTTVIFSSIGAPISGLIKDTTGSFFVTWVTSILLLICATLLMLTTKKPIAKFEDLKLKP